MYQKTNHNYVGGKKCHLSLQLMDQQELEKEP